MTERRLFEIFALSVAFFCIVLAVGMIAHALSYAVLGR